MRRPCREVGVPSGGGQEQPGLSAPEDFHLLGKLVGRLLLCSAREDQGISWRAADALHYLYRFAWQRESKKLAGDNAEHPQLQQEGQAEHTGFWLAFSNSTSHIISIFGKYLLPSERTDIILTAIEGMRDSSIFDLQAATSMLDVVLMEPTSWLKNVPKIVRCIYENLRCISTGSARHSLDILLLLLTYLYPSEVVISLLNCSPPCDSIATTMWEVMVCLPTSLDKVLRKLLSILEDRLLLKGRRAVTEDTCFLPLAAGKALCEILRQPACRQTVAALFPQLYMALLLQICFAAAFLPQESSACWRKCCPGDPASPASPGRSAVQAMKALLCCAGYEEQVLTIQKRAGWDLLLRAETHHSGVRMLAREMRTNTAQQRSCIFRHVESLLSRGDKLQEVPAMAFFVELLSCADLKAVDCCVLYLLQRYLRHQGVEMRSLVLRGLITLSKRPEMARKMQELLPDLMEMLQDANTDIRMKALVVSGNVVQHMDRAAVGPVALQLVEKLVPLFDDDSSQLRELSICHFRELVEIVMGKTKKHMQQKVHRCLLPLFFHMNDEIQSVAKASQEALITAAQCLKWEQLRDLSQTGQTWRIGKCLLARGRSYVEEDLRQSLPYLEDSQASLRDVAVRFFGLAGRHLKSPREQKLRDICSDLRPLQNDIEPSIRSLATQNIIILGTPRKQPASGWKLPSLRCWLRRAGDRWNWPLGNSSP
ncbi:maestro heat-like repeat-containing protein family member 7 [Rhea pennata]|uniref:maestro heat-like repeat-containing protein family member 7 n=1 Tax=Rhea pennata TaxID=8795 RepID=UPI002E2593EB